MPGSRRYDCLASKGAMAAMIAVPGLAGPVTVIDTRLNSNGATGVSESRALYAYKRQIGLLSAFIGSMERPHEALLVAGDFNVEQDIACRAYFAQDMLGGPMSLTGGDQRCRSTPTCLVAQVADVTTSTGRAKDWLMYRASDALSVKPVALSAPFGRTGDKTMMSDHIGVMVSYKLDGVAVRPKRATMLASR